MNQTACATHSNSKYTWYRPQQPLPPGVESAAAAATEFAAFAGYYETKRDELKKMLDME